MLTISEVKFIPKLPLFIVINSVKVSRLGGPLDHWLHRLVLWSGIVGKRRGLALDEISFTTVTTLS